MKVRCGGAFVPRRRNRLFGCILLIVLVCPGSVSFAGVNSPGVTVRPDGPVKSIHLDYTEHSTIVIESEAALQAMGYPGNGSESNPFIISNLNITANETCISIANIASYLVINGCHFERPYEDDVETVHIYNVTHCRITQCDIVGGSISAEDFYGGLIDHSNLTDIAGDAIRLYSTTYNNITQNHFSNCSLGIRDELSYANIITQNWFSQCHVGVNNDFTSNTNLYLNNTFANCSTGIHIEDEGTFANNSILDCETGLVLRPAYRANVSFNRIEGFKRYGILIENSYLCNLTGNSIEGESSLGILIGTSELMRLNDNILVNCGISLSENDWEGWEEHWNLEIAGNTVNGLPIEYVRDHQGISLNLSSYGQVIIYNCTNCLLEDGSFQHVPDGVFVAYSDSITVESAVITRNEPGRSHGIFLFESTNCTVRNCSFINSGLGVRSELYLWNHTVENCKVNGKNLGFFRGVSSTKIDADDFGQIILIDCDGVSIQNGRITNSSDGIQIIHCTECSAENLTLEWNLYTGIRLDYSTDCVVMSCNLTNNEYGAMLFHLFQCEIRNCTITHNEMGIFDQDALDCRIYYNLIGLNSLDAQTYTVHIYYDDGISLGNYWIGYDGSDFVDIYHNFAVGTGLFEIVDRFPNGTRHDWTPPVITLTSEDLTYYYGDTNDHRVYCDVEDDHSGRHRVFIDGELVRYGYWWPYPDLYGCPFAVLPNDLSVGLHNVTFLIEDLGAYFASTTIWVTVLPVATTNTTTTTITTITNTTNTTTNTTTTEIGWVQALVLGIGISSAVVIVVAVYQIARKRTMH
jgi:parallel beta-helix repeat protein